MNIVLWHVHGSWTTAFVQGRHRYLLPRLPGGGPWGGGRPAAWDWPAGAVERAPEELADAPVDVVIVQRPEEFELATRWLRRMPGRDVACVYVEHNTPRGPAVTSRHPVADHHGLTLVHVTHFNALMWDAGATPTTVIEHGIVDPGHRYTGTTPAAAVVVNEPLRRGRITGTDLLPQLAESVPLDVFGMGTDRLAGSEHIRGARIRGCGDLPQHRMHTELARRRLYLHPMRWTSLGLALIEAMQLGMPVVALATTEAPAAVPPEAGLCTNDLDRLTAGARELVADPELARSRGLAARAHALRRYGLDRFLRDWDQVLESTADDHTARRPVA
ncbi:glycosyltransferase [Pseudonocardia asaccharolytica]|uniref:Glycosyl transferase n=1 Tax=Pseudonocardia asaccharolytica DSM 44247 = NBRC 16224 TaxID=1123024 RepID=A0A511CXP1_9PSEU|nr:glycosyltransferase [Pseudonocardia asaccharolytica]GEL17319.1 glycosyl transferase [Pseudonocardia asaccharolytica DSM 44247 = NBRC 16224]